MKPAPFRYYRARNAQDAADELRRSGSPGEACILAGGQSLVPSLAARELRPALVVDIMGCGDLRHVSVSGDRLRIGAGCRQSEIENSEQVRNTCPLVSDALRWVAVPQVRTRGTVVGSLVQANAGGEMPVVALTLDAKLLVLDHDGEVSKIEARSLYGVPTGTTLEPLTLAVGAEYPILGAEDGWAFEEIQLRPGHVALVCAAAVLSLRNEKIVAARIGIGGLTQNPYRAAAAEAALIGAGSNDFNAAFADAAAMAVKERPWPSRADLHATSRYCEAVAHKAVRDALAAAVRRVSHLSSEQSVSRHG